MVPMPSVLYLLGSSWLSGLAREGSMLLCQSRVTPPPTASEEPGAGHVATIYKRLTKDGRVRYTAYIRLKGHPKQSQTFNRKADAIRWAKQHETAVQTGRYLLSPGASKQTLAD